LNYNGDGVVRFVYDAKGPPRGGARVQQRHSSLLGVLARAAGLDLTEAMAIPPGSASSREDFQAMRAALMPDGSADAMSRSDASNSGTDAAGANDARD
jgi:hypothetical protein